MQNLKILNSKEVKKIIKQLDEQFGVSEKLDFVFLLNTKDKIYLINRDIERVDLDSLRITAMGLYFATIQPNGIRLSIEGAQLVGPKATKNIFELLRKEDFEKWLKGQDFEVETDLKGFVIVKYKNDFVGCGNIKENVLLNYVPKSRRLIVVNN